jgi:O-acetyl-ADP-ribose deacetylase (regulator of RNase III)
MLTYKKGNLVDAALNGEVDYLLHGANCFSTMGSGIAASIKKVFPKAYEADRQHYGTPIQRIGDYSEAKIGNLTVVNLYCQYDYGTDYRRFEYGSFKSALNFFTGDFILRDKTIGLPKIGCGLAGAKWDLVEAILIQVVTAGNWVVYEL